MTSDTKFCSRCGSPLSPGDAFCGQCGAPVAPAQPSQATAPQQAPSSVPAEPIVHVISLQQRAGFMGMSVKSL
ncbi:MAG: zinc-ribbon domain-containing protein [Anaerolineae bacterium]